MMLSNNEAIIKTFCDQFIVSERRSSVKLYLTELNSSRFIILTKSIYSVSYFLEKWGAV